MDEPDRSPAGGPQRPARQWRVTALVTAASALVIAALALVLQPWSDGGTGATDPVRPTATTRVPSDAAGQALLDRLRGRTFEMVVLRQDGRALTLRRAPRITFSEPVAIETVCNLASSAAAVVEDRLRLPGYVTTAVACPGEGEVAALLVGEPRVLFDGTTLRLIGKSSDAELRELVGGEPAPTTSVGLAPPSTVASTVTSTVASAVTTDAPALTTDALAGATFTGPGPSAPVTLRFREGGELTATYGCNGGGGPYRVTGDVLEVDGLSVTEMGCEPDLAAQDEAVVALLLARPTLTFDGRVLTVTGPALTLRLERQDPVALVGTTWRTSGQLVNGTTLYAGLRQDLVLRPDGGWTYTGRCATVGGTYAVDGEVVTFTQAPAGVGPACGTDTGADRQATVEERAIVALLQGPVRWRLDDRVLTLTGPDGNGERFTPV